jgi:hypothetical protein
VAITIDTYSYVLPAADAETAHTPGEADPRLELAARRDPGLGRRHLAERLRRVTEQLTAADLPDGYQESFEEIRRFYLAWRAALLR